MASFNRVILLGNLTRDPELKYTSKGQAVAKIGLAVNRQYKLESGEVREEVTFIDVEAWSKQAELLAQYLRKGSPLFMEGRLKLDQWDDKNTGQKMSKLKVVLEGFQFVGGPKPGDGSGSAGGGGSPGGSSAPVRPPRAAVPSSSNAPSAGAPEMEGSPPEEDDVPF